MLIRWLLPLVVACSSSSPKPATPPTGPTTRPVVAAKPTADAIKASLPEPVADALATFRAAFGQPWSPAQQPAVEAALVVFGQIPIVGLESAQVELLLGPPDDRRTLADKTYWTYYRHNGEGGAVHRLEIGNDRVVAIERIPTQ